MSGSTVLIIDDNRDFAEGLAEFFNLYGHKVDIAFTGESGVESARHTSYDVIFVDIGLPGIDGIESTRQIRRIDPRPRCFLMTGYSSEHIAGQDAEAGSLEILSKPLDMDDLLRRIDEASGRS